MKKRNRQWLRIGVILLLLGIILLRFRTYIWEGFREIARIPMPEKAGLFLASVGYMLAEGRIIQQLSKTFHIHMKWKNGVGCAFYCSFVKLATFGSGGGAAEIYYLNREGMKPAHALDVSLLQYVCQRTAATAAGAISLLLLYPEVKASMGDYGKYFVLGVGVAVVVIAAILLVLLSRKVADLVFLLLDWIGKKKESWKGKTEEWKKQVLSGQEGVRTLLRKKGKLAEAVVLNFVKYFCWFSIPYILYKDSGALCLASSVGMMAIATVLASVIPAPGGYGSLEFMQIILFEPILGNTRTVSLAILYRAAVTFLPAMLGGIFAFFHKRKRRQEI